MKEEEEKTAEKKTAGRQKVPLVKIEREDHRYATFSKRRSGLYKKTSKLVRESGADIGIILSSPSGNLFSLFHPTSNIVLDRFENPNIELDYTTQLVAAYLHNKVNQSCDRLKEFKTREKIASQQMILFDQLNETRQIDQQEYIDQLNADDITKYEVWLNGIIFGLDNHLKQLENGASSSSQVPPENADNSSSSS
ncbi:agamous-like MADS-box protein AGL29 [Nicotiana sylvestris]|uniref:MADS-box transcription factor 31-like n=1 Tax=Nicotiana sylvestris TaxID=4096 RepID=A0A1U7YST9_NICSY|nr:PREDICTED: MADS-box transcription factor 31-like [Nicotiana sylvestris]